MLGDKTRMATLAADPHAYIRPSPSAGTLGGVGPGDHARRCRCSRRAAYDVVLVETVGVGQSEVTVAGMVDTFLFLTLWRRTGDQLQGIKKGILEIADVIAVNKADGDRGRPRRGGAAREPGRGAAAGARPGDVGAAGRHLSRGSPTSASTTLWDAVLAHRGAPRRGRARRRSAPTSSSTSPWALVRDELDQRLRHWPGVPPDPRPRCAAAGAAQASCRPPAAADRHPRGVRRASPG